MNPPDLVNPQDKVCCKCHSKKPINEFNKCKTGVYGYHNHCRECQRITKANWLIKNAEWAKQYSKLPEVKLRINKLNKQKYHSNPIWRDKHLQKNRIRRRNEPAKIKARIQRNNWYQIPHNRIAQTLRGRIRAALKGIPKLISTEEITGCSYEQLKTYIESLWLPDMTWNNYGQWEIDHIKPCASFDLSRPDEQKICFHYTNLQPLWAIDNRSKGSKLLN